MQGTFQKGVVHVLYTLKSGVVRDTGLGHHFRCATLATVLRVCVIGSAVHWVFPTLNIAFGALHSLQKSICYFDNNAIVTRIATVN